MPKALPRPNKSSIWSKLRSVETESSDEEAPTVSTVAPLKKVEMVLAAVDISGWDEDEYVPKYPAPPIVWPSLMKEKMVVAEPVYLSVEAEEDRDPEPSDEEDAAASWWWVLDPSHQTEEKFAAHLPGLYPVDTDSLLTATVFGTDRMSDDIYNDFLTGLYGCGFAVTRLTRARVTATLAAEPEPARLWTGIETIPRFCRDAASCDKEGCRYVHGNKIDRLNEECAFGATCGAKDPTGLKRSQCLRMHPGETWNSMLTVCRH
jgi:hypothetical protein